MIQPTIAETQDIFPMQGESYTPTLFSRSNLSFGTSVSNVEQMRTKTPRRQARTTHTDTDEHTLTDSSGLDSQDIEKALEKVRAEAEEERRLDSELDAIPETAYKDVEGFFKAIHKSDYGAFGKIIPLPDIMPLDDGEIGLEWRNGQKIFTLSFGGDEHIVFAGILSEESRVRGILTFSANHVVAIESMIASVYTHYGY